MLRLWLFSVLCWASGVLSTLITSEPDLSFYWLFEPFAAYLFELDPLFDGVRPYARNDDVQTMITSMFTDERREACTTMDLSDAELTSSNWPTKCIPFQWACRGTDGCNFDRNDLLGWSEEAAKVWQWPLNCMRFAKLGVGDHINLYAECADVDVKPLHESLNYNASPGNGTYDRAFESAFCLDGAQQETADFMVVALMCSGYEKDDFMIRNETSAYIGLETSTHVPKNLGRVYDMLGGAIMKDLNLLLEPTSAASEIYSLIPCGRHSPDIDNVLTRENLEACDIPTARATARAVTNYPWPITTFYKGAGPMYDNLHLVAGFWANASTCVPNQDFYLIAYDEDDEIIAPRARTIWCNETLGDDGFWVAELSALFRHTDTRIGPEKRTICTAANCMNTDGSIRDEWLALCMSDFFWVNECPFWNYRAIESNCWGVFKWFCGADYLFRPPTTVNFDISSSPPPTTTEETTAVAEIPPVIPPHCRRRRYLEGRAEQ